MAKAEAKVVDLEFGDHESMVTITPSTDKGLDWLRGNVPDYVPGIMLVVERRYVYDIYEGAQRDGCTVIQVK